VTIGTRIKQLLTERRISIKELAQATGIPASTVSQWTLYSKTPSPAVVVKIAKYFAVDLEWLITGEEPAAAIAKEMIQSLEKRFMEIHQGVYRVRIEKEVEVPSSKKRG